MGRTGSCIRTGAHETIVRHYCGGTPMTSSSGPRDRIGPYEILERLGTNGGAVYKVRHTTLGRIETLKTIPGYLFARPGQKERFYREFQFLARLRHPHILQIY